MALMTTVLAVCVVVVGGKYQVPWVAASLQAQALAQAQEQTQLPVRIPTRRAPEVARSRTHVMVRCNAWCVAASSWWETLRPAALCARRRAAVGRAQRDRMRAHAR